MRSLMILLLASVVGVSLLTTSPANAQTFSSAVWQLVELPGGKVIAPTSRYAIQFLSDGKLAIQADCERATGFWEGDSADLTITITLTVPCATAQAFLGYLAQTESFTLLGDSLTLHSPNGGTMKFEAAPI